MDSRDGLIMDREKLLEKIGATAMDQYGREVKYLSAVNERKLVRDGQMTLSPRSRCACGSGKRFKSCCIKEADQLT